jgi:hypothetical protein
VIVDSAPQASFRWIRAEVERQQTATMWSNTPAQAPREVSGVGARAFWVVASRELVATDRHRIVTVRVLHGARSLGARGLAIAVARAAL